MPVTPESRAEINALQTDMNAMKGLMSKMVEALTKIALLDERQQSVANVTSKILERVERMEEANHVAGLANARDAGVAVKLADLEKDYSAMKLERAASLAEFKLMKWLLGAAWAFIASSIGTWAFNHFMVVATAPVPTH